MTFSVLSFRFLMSLMAFVLTAGRVTSLTQLRPSLTNPRRIPPKTIVCDDAADPLLGNEVIKLPPAFVVLGTSNEVMDERPEVSVDKLDGANTLVEPDVGVEIDILPLDLGVDLLSVTDLVEAVILFDFVESSEIDFAGWDCEGDVLVVPMPWPAPL